MSDKQISRDLWIYRDSVYKVNEICSIKIDSFTFINHESLIMRQNIEISQQISWFEEMCMKSLESLSFISVIIQKNYEPALLKIEVESCKRMYIFFSHLIEKISRYYLLIFSKMISISLCVKTLPQTSLYLAGTFRKPNRATSIITSTALLPPATYVCVQILAE